MDVRLHTYSPRRTLNLCEYIPRQDLTQPRQGQHQPPNVLLFIGGMYDNFRSPKYVDDLAALFPRDEPAQKWSVFHVQLSSAGKCFGLVDLNRDVGRPCSLISPWGWGLPPFFPFFSLGAILFSQFPFWGMSLSHAWNDASMLTNPWQ